MLQFQRKDFRAKMFQSGVIDEIILDLQRSDLPQWVLILLQTDLTQGEKLSQIQCKYISRQNITRCVLPFYDGSGILPGQIQNGQRARDF